MRPELVKRLFTLNVILTSLLLVITVVMLIDHRIWIAIIDAACLFNGLILFQTIRIAKMDLKGRNHTSRATVVLRLSLSRGFVVVVFGLVFPVVMMVSK
jgi:hypothetical protein